MGETVLQSVPSLRWILFPVCISWQKLKGDLLKAVITSCNLLFFCWLSFYIIWIPISVLKLLYVSHIIPNQITENINIHWYWYLYRNCLNTFPSYGRKWIQKERENWEVRFIYKTFICLETITNKFERLPRNMVENEKDAGMSDK